MTRLVLVHGGIDFEEVRYELAEDEPWPGKPGSPWLTDKASLGLAFADIPYFIHGSLKLTQSHAILLHAARLANLLGSTAEVQAEALMLLEQSRDVRSAYVSLSYMDPASFSASKGQVVQQIRGQLDKLEAFVKPTTSGSDSFMLGELTFVDFVYADLLEQLETLSPGLVGPKLRAVLASVMALPRIREYMQSNNYIDHPYNNLSAAFR